MLFRAPTVLAAAIFAASVMARTCNPGEYRGNDRQCHSCGDGYVSSISSSDETSPYPCLPCPAGQESNVGHTQCQKCTPGNYNDSPGHLCSACPSGQFNNVSGAQSCCQCCAGYYSNNPRTHCNPCGASTPYSFPGSNKSSDCVSYDDRNGQPDPTNSCDMVADNECPNPTGSGPVGSPIARKKRDMHCTRGFQACPRYAGRGGFECVNTRSDPESCGGCRDLDGKGSGADCTAMTGVSVTRCVKGSCVIDSCSKGYTKSLDGSSCVSVSNPGAFKAQEMGAGVKRNSFAKRLARTL